MSTAFKIDTYSHPTQSALSGKLAIAQAQIERSFLEGGNVLIAVMDSVTGLTEILDQVVNLLNPEATRRVFDGMRKVVDDLADLPDAASRKQEALTRIAGLCTNVYKRVEDMQEIIRYLRTIAMTVKITGAGIPEFSGFADEIRERIQSVGTEIDHFGSQLNAMRTRLASANTSSESVIRDFASAIPELVASMDRSSLALAEQQKRMAASAQQLQQITGSIQLKIASVLSALQIGDVTRQRIEHIMSMFEALSEFRASDGTKTMAATDLASIEAAISGLARAQLEESASDFNEKCASISANIASFTADASQVLMLRDELAGHGQPSDARIFDTMKSDLERATSLSVKVAERTGDLDRVVTSVGDSTQSLIAGIANIRKIKLDIFYMALNSNLACTRLGDAGRSVNVASGELRVFADKLEVPAEGIVLQMQEIETARDLLNIDNNRRVERIDEPLAKAHKAIETVAEQMSSGLALLAEKGGSVFESIEKAIRTLDFRSDLGDVIDDCLRIAAAEDRGASTPIPAGCDVINAFSARIYKTYTMAQERVIHQQFLPVVESPAATAASGTSVDDDDDLMSALF